MEILLRLTTISRTSRSSAHDLEKISFENNNIEVYLLKKKFILFLEIHLLEQENLNNILFCFHSFKSFIILNIK